MPVRQALKTRTLFNVLGPLINPARPSYQLMGVYAPELVRPIAETLLALGLKTGMVVHGAGLDEIAIHGPTQVAEIRDGEIREYLLTPADFGLDTYPVSAIRAVSPRRTAPSPPPSWKGAAARPTTPPSPPTWRRSWSWRARPRTFGRPPPGCWRCWQAARPPSSPGISPP
jgi:anthranilate phosphoribosyltransferase